MRSTYGVLAGGLLALSLLLSPMQSRAQSVPGTETPEREEVTQPTANALVVAPGRVRFVVSPEGRWQGFWSNDRPVLNGGGFVVFASDGDGRAREIVNTWSGGVRSSKAGRKLTTVKEGANHGARFPSAQPDDDNDGMIDEDRLDGVDNDGDGRVDEDFAAIGDAMIVTTYVSAAEEDPIIEIHQESYGWSANHIDGMVATQLTVRNAGSTTIDNVHVGAVFDKPDELIVETQELGRRNGNSSFIRPIAAKGMLLRGGQDGVAVLFFAETAGEDRETSWQTGVVSSSQSLSSRVEVAMNGENGAGTLSDREIPAGIEGPTPSPGNGALSKAYGVSPNFGSLEPGEVVTVYLAMVEVGADEVAAARAIDYAYRTVVGDGTHRMIPPPNALTRRVVWGEYDVQRANDFDQTLAVTLVNPMADGVNPMLISQLSGIELPGAPRVDPASGDAHYVLRGNLPEQFSGGRVVLRGRMQNGEIFDVILKPELSGAPRSLTGKQYFSEGGKLDEELVTGSPNPFHDETTIYYEIPAVVTDDNGNEISLEGTIETSVKIYNVAGRLISTLIEETLSPGRYTTTWNARNDMGRNVASGVYYIKLQIGKRFITKRLIQVK